MRIVIATPLYPPEIGGPATYVKLLSKGLPERGIEVDLVKFSDVRSFPKVFRHILYFWCVYRAARRADLVLALDPVSVGLPSCLAARLARKPFVVKVVGDYAWEQGRQRFGVSLTLDEFVKERQASLAVRFLQRVQTAVAARAKHIIVPSQYLEDIVAAWGIPRGRVIVVHNAVPLEDRGDVPKSVKKLPRPLIVTAGRLVPWKGMKGVIHAVASLRASGVQASLAVVGDGPDRQSLVTLSEQTLKGEYVFTGALPHAEVLAVLASADVFVLNSSYEGLSHVLIEALMLGVPVVAQRVGGNPEVVTDEGNGLLVPYGDEEALGRALARVLGDESFRERLSVRAKESSHHFSAPRMLAATARVLEKVLS